jgi:hypothetical protein
MLYLIFAGMWEVEVSYGGEADLHKHLKGCTKNPGHHQFIPVDQFNIEHLPPDYQDIYIVQLVQAVAFLTVRLSVKYVSEHRPKTVRGKPFPYYSQRGSTMMRAGTGCVWDVFPYSYKEPIFHSGGIKYVDKSTVPTFCYCQECKNSPTPKTKFAEIYIHTAAHVVYDNLEAAQTTCDFFFDRGGTPETCDGVVTLTGARVRYTCVPENDISFLTFVTHDLEHADTLDFMLKEYNRLGGAIYKIQNQRNRLKSKPEYTRNMIPFELSIIVSHPHGCSKQISWGYKGSDHPNYIWSEAKFSKVYTTATCRGSSGAHVIIIDNIVVDNYLYELIHCGRCKKDKQLNVGNYFEWVKDFDVNLSLL